MFSPSGRKHSTITHDIELNIRNRKKKKNRFSKAIGEMQIALYNIPPTILKKEQIDSRK
jgi:hypothetical protein